MSGGEVDIAIATDLLLPEGYRFGAVIPFPECLGQYVIREVDGAVCIALHEPERVTQVSAAELDEAMDRAPARGYCTDRHTEKQLPADDDVNDLGL